ncbi:MAG: histidinol-phosphate transaminase [Sebaldella sp.]|jgi:histidinol-phosphate aminotransferase|nr:histidinol-phosphate transaminase [Sebaldella sp.]
MNKFWNEKVKTIKPYVPGEQPQDKKYIKLNTNESPYPPTLKVKEIINESDFDNLRLYPDPDVKKLKNEISEYYKVDSKEIFIGNGSDEILAFSYMAFFNQGEKIYYPDITYSFYSVYSDLFSLNEVKIPLTKDFKINIKDYKNLDSGMIIANPNAPTSIALGKNEIEEIIKDNQENIVIVDEAYIDFGGESVIDLVKKYDNLLVIQTFSKSRALAGMRLGFAIGNKGLIVGLERIKFSFNSYTINRLSILAGIETVRDKEYFEDTIKKIIDTREKTIRELEKLNFKVLDSKANFLFISHEKIYGEDLYLKLKDRGILVRYFKKELIDNYLRVTIGTDKEMEKFINEVKNILL